MTNGASPEAGTRGGPALSPQRLGTTGPTITRLGLGSWIMGGGDWEASWGSHDEAVAIATIHRAVERGISWIDTAPVYGLGRAEEIVGRAVRALPENDRPLIFTKCGLVWEARGPAREVLAPDSIRRECDASLQRLGVDRLDLLQIHWPARDGTAVEESWGAMADLVDGGKVRWIGVSNYDPAMLSACEQIRHVDSLQPALSLIQRDAAEELLPWCEEHGTGVIAYSPLASGLLAGHFPAERLATLAADDWRRDDDRFSPGAITAAQRLVERLRPIAERHQASIREVALAWVLAWPSVTGVIVGARDPAQVDGWVGASRITLTAEDLDEVARAIENSGAGSGPTRPPAPR